ncbi:MAG: carbon-nitrogen hydrolase family protein [Sulfolobaceae archaeon]
MSIIKVAIAQIAPDYMNKEGTINRACKAIEDAAKQGAKLIVFPEAFIPGYPYWRGILPISKWTEMMVEYYKNSVNVKTDLESIKDISREREISIVLGISEKDPREGSRSLYNSLVFINEKGKITNVHRKVMPTHGERMIWKMGDGTTLRISSLSGIRVGGLVCYENHMNIIKAVLQSMGEEIHIAVWPGYWVQEGHPGAKRRFDPSKDEISKCDIDSAIREYAFEAQAFVVSANMYMPSDLIAEYQFDIAAGGSSVVNPAGLYIVKPQINEEKIIVAEISTDEILAVKAYFDSLGHYTRWDIASILYRAKERKPIERKALGLRDETIDIGFEKFEKLIKRLKLKDK